jgi:bacterioferritin
MKPPTLRIVSKPEPPPTDIQTMRKRERQYIEEDVVRSGYAAERGTVIRLLNEALATEIACVLRYKRHYFKAATAKATPPAPEISEDASEKRRTDRRTPRIIPLRSEPNFSPVGVAARSHADYVEVVISRTMERLREMIKEDLLAEQITVDSYHETVGDRIEQDPTTRVLDACLAEDDKGAGAPPLADS